MKQKQAPRMQTGVPGCDEILGGGLVTGRSYLITGAPGTGKTVFSIQWLRAASALGKRCAYITLSEPATQIEQNVAGFGWDLEGINLIDLSPTWQSQEESMDEYRIFPPSQVENIPAWRSIYQAIGERKTDCLVIDSITQLRYLATDEYQFRKNILGLVSYLNSQNVTSFFAFEPSELEHDMAAALAVDGIIRLRAGISTDLGIGLRSLQVEKLRASDFISGVHPLRFENDGIRVFPHRVERTGSAKPGAKIISSGVPALDQLLGGGLESGTTTLLTGPTGAGKSTLGTQFLAHHASAGRAILFTFEEPAAFIASRSRNIGAPIDHLLDNGALKIIRVNPMEQYPDEFLAKVRHAVETDGRTMVMVDSLRGYQLAMEEFGKAQAHIHNLVTYLSRLGVTTLLINEVEHITSTSLKATDLGVSHLADNIVLLRYAEHAGRVIKVVCCLKKRIGNFESELRQIEVGEGGVRVSDKLNDLRGILSGLPTAN